ncbi:TadE/TadG family type IV pilus assembly protein [Streptomyces sp. NPDC057694]|uniref:TadE/TadG family type IV pilus assembly protein n=1 Tax=Streptomyces sp. NPDC057694 TaxID=3346216 RepID=UPI0036BA2BCD
MTHRLRPGWRTRLSARVRSDRGALALELSMIMPLAFLMLFTLIQGGIWFHGRSVAHHAAQQALDAQRLYNAPAGAGQQAGRDFLADMGGSLNNSQIHVSAGADRVSVQVEGDVIMLVPGWTVHVSQTVQAPVEKFRP